MDEELYRLVSTGLLGLIVVLLALTIAKLGKLGRGTAGQADAREDDGALPAPVAEASEESAAPTEEPATEPDEPQPATEEADDGPYERDGRWWYRRDGELLVYDERLEEWVDPNALEARTGPPENEPLADPGAPAERQESMGTSVTDPPEPVGQPDSEAHPLDEAKGWDATPSTFAPIPEPVSPPEPITQVETGTDPTDEPKPMASESTSHWKCPACGVINGSTATSCRMCFAARP